MAQIVGLELSDAAGNVILGATTYVGAFYGSFSTNGQASGSITDTRLIGRVLLPFLTDTGVNGTYGGPLVTLNSATGVISWAYNYSATGTTAPTIPNDTIYYGGY